MRTVVGVGVAVGVGVVEGGRSAVGAGVGLVEMTAVSAGVVVSGVATSEPPQAAMHARARRDRRVRASCRVIALPGLVQGVGGEDV